MPLYRMPNGEYVDVPANITPEGLAKVKARFKAPKGGNAPASRHAAPKRSKRQQEDDEWVERQKRAIGMLEDNGRQDRMAAAKQNFAHNFTFGADDVVAGAGSAATEGVVRAITRGDIGEIGRTYSNARRARREYREELKQAHPVSSGAGGITGMVVSPVPAKLGLARGLDKVARALQRVAPGAAPALNAARGGARAVANSAAGRVVGRMADSSVGLGARAGFNQAALTATMDGKAPGDILNEGAQGALYGGVAAGALRGGQAVARAVSDHSPKSAQRVAATRIARMLERSQNPATGKPYTPEEVRAEIKAVDHDGGDAMVADITNEGRGWASYLSKQPGLEQADELINRSQARMDDAADRFDARVRRQLNISGSAPNAHTLGKDITAGRKAAGQRDYSDEVMDRQLAWSDELEAIFKGQAVRDALPGAEKLVRLDGKDVQQLAFANNADPTAAGMTQKPSMRTMQYITQALDDIVESAMKPGGAGANTARMYSARNRELKDAIAKVNPEFAQANAVQRDAFERVKSLELGQQVLKLLSTPGQAPKVLDLISDARIKPDDLKMGFADALLAMREKPGHAVAQMRKVMRSPAQREVLAKLFGSHRSLAEFEKFMRRELRSLRTDQMVASGRQMQANLLKEPTEGGADEVLADIGKSGAQGGAFGGPLGAASRIVRQVGMHSKNLSPSAKEELAKTLHGKGEDLADQVKRSKAYLAIRERRARRLAVGAGKAPGGVIGGYSEQ